MLTTPAARTTLTLAICWALGLAQTAFCAPGAPPERDTNARAKVMIERAIGYLRTQQDQQTGGWAVPAEDSGRPHLPGISALVLQGVLLDPEHPRDAEWIQRGVRYLLDYQDADGGIHDNFLPAYNTALSVSALARVDDARARDAVTRGVDFLRRLQWTEDADPNVGGREASRPVGPEHLFYGGVGYGRNGRPDGSNLHFFLRAMEDAGVSADDESVQRALVFLRRIQMHEDVNDMPYARGSRQGGFVYATVPDAESIDGPVAGWGQSHAGEVEETLDDGTVVSRLRAYGSMTYAGFKSYLYADLSRDDPRVRLAWEWLTRNYTVEENPGMGAQGLYYYFVTMGKALDAWEEDEAPGARHEAQASEQEGAEAALGDPTANWREDLVSRLEGLQNEDGSFRSVHGRWMEDNPVLITAYALIALRHAHGDAE